MQSHIGYNSDINMQLSAHEHALCGAFSGFVTRTIIQPLDVLKIRFQLQAEPIKRNSSGMYRGVWHALVTISKTEGVRALWRGYIPAQFLTVAYGAGQFWTFALLTRTASNQGFGEGGFVHAWCGGIAGAVGTVISMPSDVVRTRIIAQGSPKLYNGTFDAWRKMVKAEGVPSLWRGLWPTLAQTTPQAALQFYFYSIFLGALTTALGTDTHHVVGLSCSAITATAAGVCAKLFVYPLDVLKKRLQMKGFEDARKQFGQVTKYTTVRECIVRISAEEGLSAWLKGLWPSILKSGVSTGLIFVTYEATCLMLSQSHTVRLLSHDHR